jgi:hypothetical protein
MTHIDKFIKNLITLLRLYDHRIITLVDNIRKQLNNICTVVKRSLPLQQTVHRSTNNFWSSALKVNNNITQ